MRWALIQSNFRCHCIARYLRLYPLPVNLIFLATHLMRMGEEVELFDLYREREPISSLNLEHFDKVVVNMGEYTADAQHNQIKRLGTPIEGFEYIGSYPWLTGIADSDPIGFEKDVSHSIFDYVQPDLKWGLIDFDDYPTIEGRKRAQIRLSRGCPNACSMCPVFMIYKTRYSPLSPKWAVKEIKKLYELGVRELDIIDDNLFADVEVGKRFLELLIKENLDGLHIMFQEGMEVRQALDKELCTLLREANFYDVRIGVETLSDEGLRKINKPYSTPDNARRAIQNLLNVGLTPRCFVISDLPGGKETIDELSAMDVKIRSQEMKDYTEIKNQWNGSMQTTFSYFRGGDLINEERNV